jgi:DNA repair photolyase
MSVHRRSSTQVPQDGGLFGTHRHPLWDSLLTHEPRRLDYFQPERIVLAAGSTDTKERAHFVERILNLYPDANVEKRLKTPHNKIPPVAETPLARHRDGKKTLVFGVHKSAVRLADEENNTCPNYWHFSPYSFCPFDCQYCYLAGTRAITLSPAVKIFVNLPEIWDEIDRTANTLAQPTAFYLGKLQDALALEPLTGYVHSLIPYFASHPFARMTLLTKAADVGSILTAEHRGRTILSWSMSPPEIAARFERNVPHPAARLAAMRRCAEAGYPVRVNFMPVIPVEGWRELYGSFLRRMLAAVPLARLTLGAICIYPDARSLMEEKLGRRNDISDTLDPATFRRDDRRQRFSSAERVEIYRFLADVAREVAPQLELALCLEEPDVMEAAGLSASRGRCNCVL